ncbi:MAG: cytidyltransferase [Euryarchaeota archaeon]|nr:cytidyltransferase [Euryarchaeota archaeon]
MKNFFQFLSESAAQQAARLGLQGNGHGDWYKDGEFVAKTVKGSLKFFNKRQVVGGKDPNQTETEKKYSDPNFVDPALQQQAMPQAPAPEQQPIPQEAAPVNYLPVEKTKGTLTIAFGRFNPPHLGHLQLMDTAAASAEQEQSDYMIVPSRSQDKKKNPLDADTKVSLMRQMFPQHSERIVNDGNTKTIFDVLKKAHNDGYANVRIVGGADRVKEFDKLANNYNNNLYQFDNIEVVSAGDRDPDSDGVEGLSASRMRLAAAENDFKTFRSGMPPEMRPKDVRMVFDTVRASMGVQDQVAEVWEIAPKFYAQTLRENYLSKTIFDIGQLVENLNTGLIGRIIRRGTNYLICVTEDNIMFKSWIKDVMETKGIVNITNISGVPADQRLIGTDSYRRYAETMVPGSSYGFQFINKYRKKKNRN